MEGKALRSAGETARIRVRARQASIAWTLPLPRIRTRFRGARVGPLSVPANPARRARVRTWQQDGEPYLHERTEPRERGSWADRVLLPERTRDRKPSPVPGQHENLDGACPGCRCRLVRASWTRCRLGLSKGESTRNEPARNTHSLEPARRTKSHPMNPVLMRAKRGLHNLLTVVAVAVLLTTSAPVAFGGDLGGGGP